MNLEETVAALLHKALANSPCRPSICDGPNQLDRDAASAVVAGLGLTVETRKTIQEQHMVHNLVTGRTDLWPTPPYVEQRIVGPWHPVKPEEQL